MVEGICLNGHSGRSWMLHLLAYGVSSGAFRPKVRDAENRGFARVHLQIW